MELHDDGTGKAGFKWSWGTVIFSVIPRLRHIAPVYDLSLTPMDSL